MERKAGETMKNDHQMLSIGFRIGQGVSSLHRILVSLILYQDRKKQENEEEKAIKNLINDIQEVINKFSL
jgi:KaiC/GvpD/RAD55 family RecA-like ATPase